MREEYICQEEEGTIPELTQRFMMDVPLEQLIVLLILEASLQSLLLN